MFDLNQVSIVGKVTFAKDYESKWGDRLMVRIDVGNNQTVPAWINSTDRKSVPPADKVKGSYVTLVGHMDSYQAKDSVEWKYNVSTSISKFARILHDVDKSESTAVIAGDVVAAGAGSLVIDVPYWGKKGDDKVVKNRRVMVQIDPSVPCYAKERQRVFITGRLINHEQHGAVIFADQVQVIK